MSSSTQYPGARVAWIAAALCILLVPAPLSLAQGTNAPLSTDVPVKVSGTVLEDARGGAVHAMGPGSPQLIVPAGAAAELEYWTRSGTEAGPPGDENAISPTSEVSKSERSFHNLSIEVARSGGPVQVLAFAERTSPSIELRGDGSVRHSPLLPSFLTKVGDAPDSQGTDERRVGFWYEPLDHWLISSGGDEVTVEGDFSLFVNNATVTLREDGELSWKNWTGYREGTNAGLAQSYEERLLVLHLQEASFRIHAPGRIQMLSSDLGIETTGAVTADSVDGVLKTSAGEFLFEAQPLRLEGSGSLLLSKSDQTALQLAVGEGDDFAVEGGEKVASNGPLPLPTQIGTVLWPAILLLVVIGGVVVARWSADGPGVLATTRDRRYTKWMSRGRELAAGRDFEDAAICFRKAIKAKPAKGVAWYHLAMATLETRDYGGALEVVEEIRASDVVVDELDLLELEAEASYRAGELDRCRRALRALSEESETMAVGLARDLDLDADTLGPELAGRFGFGKRDGGGLPGYA